MRYIHTMKRNEKEIGTVEKRVFSYIEETGMLSAGERVVAGVSGGADSVCLLELLWEYRKRTLFELAVVHVNHGLRQDASEDAAYVEELCHERGIPFFLYQVDVRRVASEEKCSSEDAGRRLRYRVFETAAKLFGADKTAVAHNSNDCAETLLFHLFRGSGLKGLRGILPVREQVIRPLLCLEREQIEAYLTAKGIKWRTDSTNAEDTYARNRIRHHILPFAEKELFSGAVERLCRTAELLSETEDYLAVQTRRALAYALADSRGTPAVRLAVDVGRVLEQAPVIRRRMLLSMAEELSPTGKDISAVHIRDMLTLFEQEGNRSITLPMGITARREYDTVVLEKRGKKEALPPQLLPEMDFSVFFRENGQEVPTNQYTKWLDYDKMREPPTLRFRQTGDYLTIADAKGQIIHKSLKDYMVTEKIPRSLRDTIPVLAEGSHVIWLVGYRISEYYKIDRNTKRVLQVKLK